MTDWKQTLRTEELEGLVTEVSLDFLQTRSPVRLVFDQSGDIEQLTPEAEASVAAVLKQLPSLERLVADTAFEQYEMVRKEFGRIYGERVEIPPAADPKDLQRLYQLHSIYLPYEPELGRFGLGFNCDWEEEHGFGLQFRNWQIIEVGGDAEAFSFYD